MILPKSKERLAQIFSEAQVPEADELRGNFYVDMLTGAPSLKFFSHCKFFYFKGEKIVGHNILLKKLKWGRFSLESNDKLEINYNKEGNSFLTKRIVDEIRRLEKGKLYLGKFQIVWGKKKILLGYFTLNKTDEKTSCV